MNKKKLIKAAGIIVFINIVSRVIGFFREMLVADAFGANYQTDAYNVAFTIPFMIFDVIGVAITTTFIPILSETYTRNGKKKMMDLANTIINIFFLISVVLFILGISFTPSLVKVIAPLFKEETYNLTIELTRISLVNVLFMSMTSGYIAILQTMEDFIAPTLIGVVLNFPIIIYIMFFNNRSITGLMYATTLGFSMQVFIQIPWLIKNRYKPSIKVKLKDEKIKKMIMLVIPVLIGTGVNQINSIVSKMLASGLPDGSISSLSYATKLNSMIFGIFATTIVTVIYPTLSREGCLDEYDIFKKHIRKGINIMNLFMIPTTIGIIVLRKPIVSVLFNHGMFDVRAVNMTSDALLYLSIGMVFCGVRSICDKAFFALQETRIPMKNGILGVLVNIITNLIFVKHMGISGLALGTSISAIVCSLLLIRSLKMKIGGIGGKHIFISSIKILCSSLVMGVIVFYSNNHISAIMNGLKGKMFGLISSVTIGIVVYVIMLLIFKVEEFEFILAYIKKKFIKKYKMDI